MKAAVISLGSKSSVMIQEELEKHFDQVDAIKLRNTEVQLGGSKQTILVDGNPLDNYDCILLKGSFRYAPTLASMTTILQDKCYLPISADAFSVAHDKLLTHLALHRNGIPMPETYIASSITAARQLLKKINFPIIMKFPQGTQGKGVMFADSYKSAVTILDALSAIKQPFILQEFIETKGSDIRAIVVGDHVVASMKRVSKNNDDIRANIHAGGEGQPYSLTPQMQRMAVKTAKAIGAEICGVDMLESYKGALVIEANVSPGLQGITEATKINVAGEIAKYLAKKTSTRVNSHTKQAKEEIVNEVLENKKNDQLRSLITNVNLRGERILLPELVTKISRLSEENEVTIDAQDGKILIKKL